MPVDAEHEALVAQLSPIQRSCLHLVAKGFETKEIARALGISPLRAGKHIQAAMEKLRVNRRRDAARLVQLHDPEGVNDSPGMPSTLFDQPDLPPSLPPANGGNGQPSGLREMRAVFDFDERASPDPRLPLREPGSSRNDLSKWHRTVHILFLATVFIAAVGVMAMGLGSISNNAQPPVSRSR